MNQTKKPKDPSLTTFSDLLKQDRLKRRQFIERFGLLLGVLGTPSLMKSDKMAKVSKLLLGSPYAFSQSSSAGPVPHIEIGFRSGYQVFGWMIGMQTDDGITHLDRNQPWNPALNQGYTTKDGIKLTLPEHAQQPLSKYVDGIHAALFRSAISHRPFFRSSHRRGFVNIQALAASQNVHDSLIKKPVFFGTDRWMNMSWVAPELRAFAPIATTKPDQFKRLVKNLDLSRNPNVISPEFLAILENKFNKDVQTCIRNASNRSSTISSLRAGMALANSQMEELFNLDPSKPGGETNLALLDRIRSGASLADSPHRFDMAKALFIALRCMSSGLTPMHASMVITTGDWHSLPQTQGQYMSRNDHANTRQYQTAKYYCQLLGNVLDEVTRSGTPYVNPSTNQSLGSEGFTITTTSEFNRGVLIRTDASDNPDGGGQAVVALCADPGQSRFLAGAMNEIKEDGSVWIQDASGQTSPSPAGRGYLEHLSLAHHARLLNIDLSQNEHILVRDKETLDHLFSATPIT